MSHEARQVPSWLIFDVGQECARISMRTIGSESQRWFRGGPIGPALFRVHATPEGRPASLAGGRVQQPWPLSVRIVPGFSALLTPRRRTFFREHSRPHFQVATFARREVRSSCRPMKSPVRRPSLALGPARRGPSFTRSAQQGARANAGTCHESC